MTGPVEHQPFSGYDPEDPLAACRALAHHLTTQMALPRDQDPERLIALITDYAGRAQFVATDRPALDRKVIDALAPRQDLVSVTNGAVGTTESAEAVSQPGGLSRVEPKNPIMRADISISTALPEELDAVLHVFGVDPGQYHQHGRRQRRYYQTSISALRPKRELSVIITDAYRSGGIDATQEMADLDRYYDPMTRFFIGIAAGHPDHLNIGDIVVPDWVYYYEPGRVTDQAIQGRYRPTEASRDLIGNMRYYRPNRPEYRASVLRFLQYVAANQEFSELPTSFVPRIIMRNLVIASGEKTIRSRAFMDELYDYHNDAKAVDQESYAFGYYNNGQRWAVIRTISDHGDSEESSASDTLKFAASGLGALFLRDFLENVYSLREVPPATDG